MKSFIIGAAFALAATQVVARDNVHVTGSSTVLPYATIVAEAFGENFDFPTPVVEGGGSGAGRKKLCEGTGTNTVDIANSSSKMKEDEWKACEAVIGKVTEVRIGYDGIVFASDINGPAFEFTPSILFEAMAAEVLVNGKLVPNPHNKWSDIESNLPNQEILVFVPGTKHGTREVFDVKAITEGCKMFETDKAFKARDGDTKKCTALRTDGRVIDIDGDYSETLSRLAANKTGVGVFGLSFYENNTDKLQVATFQGITPTRELIADGTYRISRPIFFYVKTAHLGVVPGLYEFIEFFMSDDMAGPGGPLEQYGLVPDPALAETQAMIAGLAR
jgi:phosphate transport system substrate-binding protein